MKLPVNKTIRFLLAGLGIFLISGGCAVQQAPPPQPPVVPDFAFKPPSTAAERSPVKIAIIGPNTEGNLFSLGTAAGGPPGVNAVTAQMLGAARTDLQAIVVAKGFNALGPFASLDEMTYSDKKDATFLFVPTFQAAVEFQGGPAQQNGVMVFQTGNVVVTGSVTMELREPMSKELLWDKHITLEPVTAPYALSGYTRQPEASDLLANAIVGIDSQPHDTRVRAVTAALNKFYPVAMEKIWEHLDPAEILSLQGQVREIRKKSHFTAD